MTLRGPRFLSVRQYTPSTAKGLRQLIVHSGNRMFTPRKQRDQRNQPQFSGSSGPSA